MILRSIGRTGVDTPLDSAAVEGLRIVLILNADYDFIDASDVNYDEVSLRRWPRYCTFLTALVHSLEGGGIQSSEHAL